jgi:DNA-binding MarR family transcriptional regulator/ribosomal protein S18 acetylase RimI-like enzyme
MGKAAMSADVIRAREHLFLGSRLKRLAEQMQADVAIVAQRAGLGIQPGQYPVLAVLDEAGPQTVGELAQHLGISQPAVTKTIDRLSETGLVEGDRNGADRRRKIVSLSATGRRLLERSKQEVWPLVETAVKAVTDDLSGPLLEQIAQIEKRLAIRSLNGRVADAQAPQLVAATDADVPAVVELMNRAYRGEGADAGWTTEAGYIRGERTNAAMVRQDIAANPASRMLLWRSALDAAVLGCVWVEPKGSATWYLGSLTIDPRQQNAGLGRRLLTAAETWILRRGGREVRMTVVNVRDTLLAWYARRGYVPTGEIEPFAYGDNRFGVPLRDDLNFVVLGKSLENPSPPPDTHT